MNTLLKYCLIASFLVGGLVGNVWAEEPATAEETAAATKPAIDPKADAKAAELTVTQALNELAIELKADASALDADDQTAATATLEALTAKPDAPASIPAVQTPVSLPKTPTTTP